MLSTGSQNAERDETNHTYYLHINVVSHRELSLTVRILLSVSLSSLKVQGNQPLSKALCLATVNFEAVTKCSNGTTAGPSMLCNKPFRMI